jgi:two-component system nitrogen regulation response regulator NtrX
MSRDILIVDDENDIRDLISGILSDEGFQARTAKCSETAISAIKQRCPSLIVLDIWLQGSKLDGIELLDIISQQHPELPVVIISGHGNIETAVTAIKKGAYDFIEKPFKADKLVLTINRALETSDLRRENSELRQRTGGFRLIGQSQVIAQLRNTIERVAVTGSRVMITGPSGSGKEVVARLLHEQSRRAEGPFVAINAASMSPDRVEIELFGTEPLNGGSRKVGVFEQAHGGTLYLDEVGDMPAETQGKILRILVDQTFERVGGNTKVQVDVRVISSTSRPLRDNLEGGGFREDLYHRLAVVPLTVPSLAERREDIPLLVEHFVEVISSTTGLPRRTIAPDAMAALQAHAWPGNVRQLRNNIERLLILAGGDSSTAITVDMLPSEVGGVMPSGLNGGARGNIMGLPLREAREVFERDYLLAQINRFGGNISRTASFIGMERSALHRKLKSLGVQNNGRGGTMRDW